MPELSKRAIVAMINRLGPVPDDNGTLDNGRAGYLTRLLITSGFGQRESARLLRVDERTFRRWVADEVAIPWASVELLRRMAIEAHSQ